ncbi:MAG: DUF4468 domain-containing protein [Bacteroidota bacterium]|jgi:hypothetical protein
MTENKEVSIAGGVRWIIIVIVFLLTNTAVAQFGFDPASGSGGDSAVADPSVGGGMGGFGGFGGGEGAEGEAVVKKAPYKRFIPPYDTMREIIFYENIIEDEECENCNADSLYWRAKKYLTTKLGKETIKKMVIEDKVAERLVLRITVPMMTTNGTFTKKREGDLEYRLTLRFKDSRYKYQFGNFVHVEPMDGISGNTNRTYHEHYMRLKKGFQQTDKYLLAAEAEVNLVVDGLKKSLREPYQPDEDDW